MYRFQNIGSHRNDLGISDKGMMNIDKLISTSYAEAATSSVL